DFGSEVYYGSTVVISDLTVYEGNTYTGYSYTGQEFVKQETFSPISITTGAEHMELTLYFTGKTYNITYDVADGTNGASNPTSYTAGINVQPPSLTDPTREGYIFSHWTVSWADDTYSSTLPTVSGASLSIPAHTHGNIKLTAVW